MTTQDEAAARICPLCEASASLALEHPVLGRYQSRYYLCGNCRFVFARPADWLAEAYSSALAVTDTGAVQRNINVSEFLSTFARFSGLGASRGLDVGGGHGLLVRMLRDYGLDFRWSDQYAENLFARGFEDDGGIYDWVTLVEVFEHLVEPGAFVAELVRRTSPRCVFMTTELKSAPIPPLDWRYWSFETGKHIGFAERKSLEALALRLGYRLTTRGAYHLFYREPKLGRAFALATTRIRHLYSLVARRSQFSLTWQDHLTLVEALRKSYEVSEATVLVAPPRRNP